MYPTPPCPPQSEALPSLHLRDPLDLHLSPTSSKARDVPDLNLPSLIWHDQSLT